LQKHLCLKCFAPETRRKMAASDHLEPFDDPIDSSADAVCAAVAGRVHLREVGEAKTGRVFPAVLSSISFLGTSSAKPQPGKRNTSSLVVTTHQGSCIMVDCGEGTQHQMMKSSTLKMTKIRAIFVTHLHGDHCFGLPGLLCTLSLDGRTAPLPLVGPIGVKEMVETVLRLSGAYVGYSIVFHELDGTQAHDFTVDLQIENNKAERLLVHASPLSHGIPTLGYFICELTQESKLDSSKAMALGVRGPDLGRLKRREDVVLPDGTTVRSEDVLHDPPPRRAVGLLWDTMRSEEAEAYLLSSSFPCGELARLVQCLWCCRNTDVEP